MRTSEKNSKKPKKIGNPENSQKIRKSENPLFPPWGKSIEMYSKFILF
jgi:hypothetical protein